MADGRSFINATKRVFPSADLCEISMVTLRVPDLNLLPPKLLQTSVFGFLNTIAVDRYVLSGCSTLTFL